MNYKTLDKLQDWQDTLLALASYDWHFFNDMRIFGLINDWKVDNSAKEIFTYYHGKNEWIELNHNRYAKAYKNFLNTTVRETNKHEY